MDNFEELAVTAGYTDALVRVTKYRSGLDPQIDVVITTSATAPDLTDYDGWCVCTFRQYEASSRARTGNPLAQLPATLPRPRAAGVFPAPAPTCEFPITSDVRHTDVLDEIVRQLGDDLLGELFARVATIASLPDESADEDVDPAGFPTSAE
jgi:hypothetical protein